MAGKCKLQWWTRISRSVGRAPFAWSSACCIFWLTTVHGQEVACITVTSEVGCFAGTNTCGTFGKQATGVQGDTQSPEFCYRITITNCGNVALTNFSAVDDQFGDLSAYFPCAGAAFAPGDNCAFEFRAVNSHSLTNTITVGGQSLASGQRVTSQDYATAIVLPAGVRCTVLLSTDGGPLTNNITAPTNGLAHTVTWFVVLTNTGSVSLENLRVSTTAGSACDVQLGPLVLPVNGTLTVPLCTNYFDCFGRGTGANICTVLVQSDQFSSTNGVGLCALNTVVQSECVGSFVCISPPGEILVLSRGIPGVFNSPTNFSAGPTLASPCGTFGSSAKWFRIVMDWTYPQGVVDISTEGSSYDTLLGVYTGPLTSPTNLSLLACNDNVSTKDKQSRINFIAPPSAFFTYPSFVVVDGNGNNGTLKLTVGYVPTLQSYGFSSNGYFSLQSAVAPALAYQLQSSTNFSAALSNWSILLSTNLMTNFPYVSFVDTNSSRKGARYYRIGTAAP